MRDERDLAAMRRRGDGDGETLGLHSEYDGVETFAWGSVTYRPHERYD
jgi:hypothetical protein